MNLLFTISILFVSTLLFSQEITLLDKKTNSPIKGVKIESTNFKGISNKKGEIDLSDVSDSTRILFIHIGYTPFSIPKGKIVDQVVFMQPINNYLPIIDITHPLRDKIDVKDDPHQITIISKEDLKNEKPQSSADMLQQTGNVFVQKTQGGGGSPVIRGFEANKILLVIDGVRMNNAIYRSGHLQNSLTIDNSILSHTEIILGPNSVLYGSDALGGVIHFHTENPTLATNTKWLTKANASSYYNSVDKSLLNNLNFSVAQKKWGFLGSYTHSNFGNFKMGENRQHGYDDWGLQDLYIGQHEGKDSSFVNSDPSFQTNSAYSQHDFLGKFYFAPSNKINYTLNTQYSTSSSIDRYDKSTEIRNGNLRYGEWYYGPQKRLFGSFKMAFKQNKSWVNNGTIILSYQQIDEDRISRNFNSIMKNYQLEDVQVLGLNIDLNKVIDSTKALYYGLEIQQNFVSSTAFSQNTNTLDKTPFFSRYPDGGSDYLSSGLYIEYKQQFNPRLLLSTGLRYSYIYANSVFDDTSLIKFPFNEVKFSTGAPSGHIGLNYSPDGRSLIKASLSSGFRAPNIDDYGKVYEKKGYTVIPNNDLKPEYAFNGEVSAERIFGNNFITLSGSIFYTYLINTLVRKDFTLNGEDSIYYDGELTKIQANINTDNAYIFGFNLSAKVRLTKRLSTIAVYNYTKGWDIADKSPLAHISPDFGKIELKYQYRKINTGIYTYYNFKKPVSEYGGSIDNLDEATIDGTPAWWTLNFRFSYDFAKSITAQFYMTNILDQHYRQFSSAISAPGRSFKLGIRISI